MSKTARVLITSQCVRKCSYCCNKLPEVQETIKFTTMDQFIENAHKYDVINITGGEPLLESKKLLDLINKIMKIGYSGKIYLYTTIDYTGNEFISLWEIVKNLDGINIGCHDDFNDAFSVAYFYKHIYEYYEKDGSVQFGIQTGRLTEEQRNILIRDGIKIKEWVMNECSNVNEDRFII